MTFRVLNPFWICRASKNDFNSLFVFGEYYRFKDPTDKTCYLIVCKGLFFENWFKINGKSKKTQD